MLGVYTYYSYDGDTLVFGRTSSSSREHHIGVKDVSTGKYIGTLHTDSTFKPNNTSNPQYYSFTKSGSFEVKITGLANRSQIKIVYYDGSDYTWTKGKTTKTTPGTTTYSWKNM